MKQETNPSRKTINPQSWVLVQRKIYWTWKQTVPLQSSPGNIKVNHPSNQRHMEKEATLHLPWRAGQDQYKLLRVFCYTFDFSLHVTLLGLFDLVLRTLVTDQLFNVFSQPNVSGIWVTLSQFQVQRLGSICADNWRRPNINFQFFHKLCWTFLQLKPFLLQDKKKSGSGTESQGDEVTLGILLFNIEST